MERSRAATSYATCHLCEAACGLEVVHHGAQIESIRGNADDVHSQGYVCPKATGIADVQSDPDRVRTPLRKKSDGSWEPISWDAAIALTTEKIAALQAEHGKDSVAWYHGNPTGHSSSALLYAIAFTQTLGTRNLYSAQSVDALPRVLASYLMYGNQGLIPVPDLDRTDFLLILGANPVVSNGSAMSSPYVKKRLKRIRGRGGRVVVVDPRRTETADVAGEHVPIRPGSDALFLASMLRTVFEEELAATDGVLNITDGVDALRRAVQPFSPERVQAACGIDAVRIRELAHDFASAERATCYGRMGISTQRFGTLTTCLVDALNLCTGNLDRPGGAMFASPAIDLAGVAAMLGQSGSSGRWTSRVSGYPEFNGELPVAGLAEEMETPGEGQIRALIIHAGNPVLSIPDGGRLDTALEKLEFMVAIDIYVNETTRHADLILPPSFGFEHDHYPLLALGLAVRNATKMSPAIMPAPDGVRHDWEILLALMRGVLARRGTLGRIAGKLAGTLLSGGPEALLKLAVRLGPHGVRGRGLTWAKIAAEPNGIDLGALVPRLPKVLQTQGQRIDLWPAPVARDIQRLEDELAAEPAGTRLTLISRRHLRCNNSWMHNSERLVKGPNRCTVQIHPDDAQARNVTDGHKVTVKTDVGEVEVNAEISDAMMPGVISLPHGWGHAREGAKLGVAAQSPGVSVNDLTASDAIDPVSGCSSFATQADVSPQSA